MNYFSEFFSINLLWNCSELVYSRIYSNLTKIFVLRLLEMATDQTERSRLKKSSAIKYLIAKNCKRREIYRMYDVYGEACANQKCLQMGKII